VFRGVFFGEGEVATALPELWVDGQQAANPLAALNRADQIRALERTADDLEKNGADPATAKTVRALAKAMTDDPSFDPMAAVQAREAALLEAITLKDPTFFDRFGAAMQSGDRLRIEAMLTQSFEKIRTLAKRAAVDDAQGGSGSDLHSLFGCDDCEQEIVVAQVQVYVLFAYIIDSDGAAAQGPNKTLQRAELVDLIARRLRRS
jgi:SdpC family antimicrobial peptide